MTTHQKTKARKFFTDKIILEASTQGVPLSNAEIYMLNKSEVDPDFIWDSTLEDAFEEVDTTEFESRVGRLVKSAYDRDKQLESASVKSWQKAFVLLDEDYDYLREIIATTLPRVERPFAKELRDLLLYIAIAVILIGAFVLYMIYVPPDTDLRWYGLGGVSVSIFGFALFIYRKYIRNRRFWLAYIAAIVIHTILWTNTLSKPGAYDLNWFLWISMYEGAGVLALLYIIGEGKLKAIWDLFG